LINLGTNRWAFKPEFAVSHPMGQKWLADVYAGLWLFTTSGSFYPGSAVRTQASKGAFQAHVSYNFQRQLWAAFDATYYVGGRSTGRHHPLRRELHNLLHRVADGMGSSPQTHSVVLCERQSRQAALATTPTRLTTSSEQFLEASPVRGSSAPLVSFSTCVRRERPAASIASRGSCA